MSLINVTDKIDNQRFFLPLYSSSDMYTNFTDEEMSMIIYTLLNNLNLIYLDNKHLQKDILDFLVICNFNYIINYYNIEFDNELISDFKEKILLETDLTLPENQSHTLLNQLLLKGGLKSGGAAISDPKLNIEKVSDIDKKSIKDLLEKLNNSIVKQYEEDHSGQKFLDTGIIYIIYNTLNLTPDEIQIFNKVNNILLILKYNDDEEGNEDSQEYISFYEYICCNILKIHLDDNITTSYLDDHNIITDESKKRKIENDAKIKTIKLLMEMRSNILNNTENSSLIYFDWELDYNYHVIQLQNKKSSPNIAIGDIKSACINLLIININYSINKTIVNKIKELFFKAHKRANIETTRKYPKKELSDYEEIFKNLSKIDAGHIFDGSELIKSILPGQVKGHIVGCLAMFNDFTNARELSKLTTVNAALKKKQSTISYRDLLLQKQFIKITIHTYFFKSNDIQIETDVYKDIFKKHKIFLLSEETIEELESGVSACADVFTEKNKEKYISHMNMIKQYKDKINQYLTNCENLFTIFSNIDGSLLQEIEIRAEKAGITDFAQYEKLSHRIFSQIVFTENDMITYFNDNMVIPTLAIKDLTRAIQSTIHKTITDLTEIVRTHISALNLQNGAGLFKINKKKNKSRKYLSNKFLKSRISKKLFKLKYKI